MIGKNSPNSVEKILDSMMQPMSNSDREERVKRFGFSPDIEKKILKSDRCFIAATGPSLAKIDPESAGDEFVIGVNHILRSDIKPDILCIVDPSRFDIDYVKKYDGKIIVPHHVFNIYSDILKHLDCYSDIEYTDHQTLKTNVQHINELDPDLRKIYWSASVVSDLCIPLAVYLGFKEVYTIGLDGIRSSFPSSHVWGQEQNIRGPADSMVHYLHQIVGTLADKAGCKVCNASFGGYVNAFPKRNLLDIAPAMVRGNLDESPENKFILFKGTVLTVTLGTKDDNVWRMYDAAKNRWLTRKGRRIILEAGETTASAPESHFYIEPSFIRADWCALRAFDMKGHYITAENSFSSYDLRPASGFFSPYFSSFQLYKNEADTNARNEIDKLLASIDQQTKSLGNLLVSNDRKA